MSKKQILDPDNNSPNLPNSLDSMGNLNFIDLFSGCGGLSIGMEMAGHSCLLGVDHDKDSMNTFKLNHPKAQIFREDIKDLSKEKLEELLQGRTVDMIVGGPPCQGFSTIGKGEVSDERNVLFKEFIRIVKILNPKIIVFENVTGLLALKNKPVLDHIFSSFESLGYQMDARVLSSEEYGVPEVRRRAIIMGSKNCAAPIFPKITHGDRGKFPLNTVGNALENLYADDGKIYNHEPHSCMINNEKELERLRYIPEGKYIRYEKDEAKYLPKDLWYPINWNQLSEKRFRQAKLQRLDRNLPSPTILTSRTSYYHPTEHRYLTPREAAACQSFPNHFIFTGSLTSQFKQIGNAVPPLLAKAIGQAIQLMVNHKEEERGKDNFQTTFNMKVNRKEVNFSKYAFSYDLKPTI